MTRNSQWTRERFFELNGFMPPWSCYFCGKPIDHRSKRTGGSEALNVHHVNDDWTDNSDRNLVPSHARCHLDYHRMPYDVIPYNVEDD